MKKTRTIPFQLFTVLCSASLMGVGRIFYREGPLAVA